MWIFVSSILEYSQSYFLWILTLSLSSWKFILDYLGISFYPASWLVNSCFSLLHSGWFLHMCVQVHCLSLCYVDSLVYPSQWSLIAVALFLGVLFGYLSNLSVPFPIMHYSFIMVPNFLILFNHFTLLILVLLHFQFFYFPWSQCSFTGWLHLLVFAFGNSFHCVICIFLTINYSELRFNIKNKWASHEVYTVKLSV